MPNGLTVSPEVLKERASEIRKQVQSMNEILNSVSQEFAKIPDSYAGEAANALVNKYNNLKKRYDSFTESMESYATFLDKTAETYSNLSTTLASKANELLDE